MSRAEAAGRTVDFVLAEVRALIESPYRAVVDVLPPEVRHVAGYHIGWWEADGAARSVTGKALRPVLALTCARAAGGSEANAIPAALSVELVHDFSLLHDDVMDGDTTRRHRPTAWTVFGAEQAILVGDVLLTLAVEQASLLPDAANTVKVLTGALRDLCAGQWSDLAYEDRAEVTLADCVRMAEGKTGALLGAACELGAIAGGATSAQARCFREFGRHLGVAFQLIDDVLGIWGDPQTTGKPVGADLVARKKSLPVVAALTSDTDAGRRLAWIYRHNEALGERSVAYAADLVESAGGRWWAQHEADRRLEEAFVCLGGADPDPAAVDDLRVLASLITRRDH
ncbi:polyprenyl synthetase family protein [Streptomyces sp. NPDC060085]|uniref:polyprenyl synthetase family protein n=1 Tax=Streptomyces sp. NPDC060085 TaxID=3347054 RepID=UPI00365F9772